VNHSVAKIIGTLAVVMMAIFAVWELLERSFWNVDVPSGLGFFYMARGISTAIVMVVLTAWLFSRYRRRYEDLLREQSEEAQRTRRFFENIVQDAGEAIISLDRDGVIRTWNRSAEQIYGYKAEEIIGQKSHIVVPPDLVAAGEPERLTEDLANKGFIRDYETKRVRKDGTIIRVRITRSALRDDDGSIIGSSAIVRDVTAEEQMERRLIHAEKLAAIGQAAASIAHEVRNALAGISGAVQVLKGSASWKELPEGFGEEVDLQVGRIAQIVNDLLSYARLGTLSTQPTDLHQVLDRVLSNTSHGPEADNKRIHREYASGAISVEADPGRLEQAFANLIVNAFQAMRPGGTLEVQTEHLEDEVQVRFSDSGCGMPPETMDRAFEAFFTTKVRGTGLGLPIVRTIIEAHKGTVDLRSSPHDGTTVTLTLPCTGSTQRVGGRLHAR
jgi:PAS domain S-box-containing protein